MRYPLFSAALAVPRSAFLFLVLPLPFAGAEPSESTAEPDMRAKINVLVLDDLKNGSAPKPVQLAVKNAAKEDLAAGIKGEITGPVIVLPKVVVEAERITKLKQDLATQDHLIAQETKCTEPTVLDNVLNAPIISFFGGASSKARAAAARHRVEVMGWERIVLIAIAEAKTEKEKDEWREMLREMHDFRR